jgi:hypothetical protein
MVRREFALTAENGELLIQINDTGTSPRRGGPRFVDENDQKRVDRTLTQLRRILPLRCHISTFQAIKNLH